MINNLFTFLKEEVNYQKAIKILINLSLILFTFLFIQAAIA